MSNNIGLLCQDNLVGSFNEFTASTSAAHNMPMPSGGYHWVQSSNRCLRCEHTTTHPTLSQWTYPITPTSWSLKHWRLFLPFWFNDKRIAPRVQCGNLPFTPRLVHRPQHPAKHSANVGCGASSVQPLKERYYSEIWFTFATLVAVFWQQLK